MGFINRQEEQRLLLKRWKGKQSEFVVVYGKRRVGKTELILQLLKQTKGIYFLGDKRSESEQLIELGLQVGRYFNDSLLMNKGFSNWEEFFHYLREHVKERILLALDEFPYLIENNPALPSIFQKGWDQTLKNLPIYLILCGSSIAMMESEVLGGKSPLFGRRTGQLLIHPFSFKDSRAFFPKLSFERSFELFSITGGMPAYLKEMDPKVKVETNVEKKILERDRLLFRDMEIILREELREPRHYLSILRSIAYGKRRFSEIINDTHLGGNILPKYLGILEDLRIIEKEVPVTEKNPILSKRGLYRIVDPYTQFWLLFVYPFRSSLEIGDKKDSIGKFKKQFHVVIERAYESIARETLLLPRVLPFPIERIGRWWDGGEEIDLVCLNEEEDKILFVEVKWSNKQIGTNILEELKRKASLVQWKREERKETLCLFSKSGYTKDLLQAASQQKILLFHGNEPLKI